MSAASASASASAAPGTPGKLEGSRSTPPGGFSGGGKSGSYGKAGSASSLIIHLMPACNLSHSSRLKIASAVAVIASIALTIFLACYTGGVFHFEKFLGQIGPITSLTLSSLAVVASVALLYLSFNR